MASALSTHCDRWVEMMFYFLLLNLAQTLFPKALGRSANSFLQYTVTLNIECRSLEDRLREWLLYIHFSIRILQTKGLICLSNSANESSENEVHLPCQEVFLYASISGTEYTVNDAHCIVVGRSTNLAPKIPAPWYIRFCIILFFFLIFLMFY